MCAKKASPSTPSKPAAGKNGVAPTAKTTKKAAAAKPAAKNLEPAASGRVLSSHDIGAVAGDVWGLLADKDSQSLAAIKKAVPAPGDVVAAAIGWLAREDKLAFTGAGKTLKISLKA